MSSLVRASNRNYYLQFYDASREPKKKSVPLKTKSRRVAEKVRVLVDEMVLTGKLDPWVTTDFQRLILGPQIETWALRDGMDAFVDAKSLTRWTPATRRTYEQVLDQFEGYLKDHEPSVRLVTDVTADVISRWLVSTNANPTTRRKNVRHLKAFFTWMTKERGMVAPDGTTFENPASGVDLPKAQQRHPQYLTPKEVDAITQGIDAYHEREKLSKDIRWIAPVIRCNVELGLRAAEVCGLQWSNVSFADGVIRVYTTKGSTDRTVPMSPHVTEILRTIRAERAEHLGVPEDEVPRSDYVFKTSHDAGKLCPRLLSRRFKHFAREGLGEERGGEVKFHTTRHTAGSMLAQANKSPEFIREYLGHSSISVALKYMHLAPSQVRAEAVEVFTDLEAEAQRRREKESLSAD
ncbi:tyrosine-type recombinase/integrase [Rubrivirga sp. IMCC45206]|uniref:tyrosine-type recombinase/integrase n=1 Tax=Rubrivirga sp. IMCC45206 TaxID=3391614 RepID=UPI00398FEBC8